MQLHAEGMMTLTFASLKLLPRFPRVPVEKPRFLWMPAYAGMTIRILTLMSSVPLVEIQVP